MEPIQKIKIDKEGRVETGPVKFNNDWTGVFIRGDNAFNFALKLKDVVDGKIDLETDSITKMELQELVRLLTSCIEGPVGDMFKE
jgi:hypothetical protein